MALSDYLIRNVSESEFRKLAQSEAGLVLEARGELNTDWRERTELTNATFMYNPGRECIGLYVERKTGMQLIVDKSDIANSEEGVLVRVLYGVLVRKLGRNRLPLETWIPAKDVEKG